MTEPSHDEQIALADPVDEALLASSEVEHLVSRLALEIAHEHQPPRAPRRRRLRG